MPAARTIQGGARKNLTPDRIFVSFRAQIVIWRQIFAFAEALGVDTARSQVSPDRR